MGDRNKNIKLFGLLCVCAVVGFFAYSGAWTDGRSKTAKIKKTEKADKNQQNTVVNKDEQIPQKAGDREKDRESKAPRGIKARSVASVPPQKEAKWKKPLYKRLARNLQTTGAIPEIKDLGPRKMAKGAASVSAQHVLISINKGGGELSSYEALVEPNTGRILHTWNKTRFELSKPKTLKVFPLRR